MTAENQSFTVMQENVYQGKKWGIGKIIAIFAAVCATMCIRDIGMTFVYGLIYDGIYKTEDGVVNLDAGASFWMYALTAVLFVLPLVFPFIITLRKGAYFDEPFSSLFPNVNKAVNIILYVLVALALIVPVSLTAMGVFSSAYMFVAFNMLLVLATNVFVFYYFGTYVLQRAKVSLTLKYLLPTAFMIVVVGISTAVSFGAAMIFKPDIVTYFDTYAATKESADLWIPGLCVILSVALSSVISGLLYHLTQNIIYAVVPTFVLSYPNVVLFQRVNEAAKNILKIEGDRESTKESLARELNRLNPNQDLVDKYENAIEDYAKQIDGENVGIILCYVVVGLLFAALLIVAVRAIVGLIKQLKESK